MVVFEHSLLMILKNMMGDILLLYKSIRNNV